MNDAMVSREAQQRLAAYEQLVLRENTRQNLVSEATLPTFYDRHVEDSLQLVPLCKPGPITDVGSGAGLPGIVIAIVTGVEVHLIEPRRLRADFLRVIAVELALPNVVVHQARIEQVKLDVAINILARAVMPLDRLFAATCHLATANTRYVLPKGKTAQSELETALRSWQGEFRLVPSRTDPASSIVVADRVHRRER